MDFKSRESNAGPGTQQVLMKCELQPLLCLVESKRPLSLSRTLCCSGSLLTAVLNEACSVCVFLSLV